MPLQLTLKPGERIVINGCVIRNSDNRQTITIENKADVIRGKDLLDAGAAATPVSRAYFLVQTVLIRAELRDRLVPMIQEELAALATVFGPGHVHHIFEAANFVSMSDYYKALAELRPVLQHEQVLLASAAQRAADARMACVQAAHR